MVTFLAIEKEKDNGNSKYAEFRRGESICSGSLMSDIGELKVNTFHLVLSVPINFIKY